IVVLKGAYADYPSTRDTDPMSLLLGGLEKPGSFFDLCDKLDQLAGDDEVQHVLFDLSSPTLQMNLAQLSELDRHIARLREAGKRTFAWLETADTCHYAIASGCDTILMTDLGALDLPSLSLRTLHFHDAMELLGAKASFVRTGDFKGAVEPFTLSEMSDQLRAHYKEMLVSMNDALLDQIGAGRKLSREQLRKVQSDRLFTPAARFSTASGRCRTCSPRVPRSRRSRNWRPTTTCGRWWRASIRRAARPRPARRSAPRWSGSPKRSLSSSRWATWPPRAVTGF